MDNLQTRKKLKQTVKFHIRLSLDLTPIWRAKQAATCYNAPPLITTGGRLFDPRIWYKKSLCKHSDQISYGRHAMYYFTTWLTEITSLEISLGVTVVVSMSSSQMDHGSNQGKDAPARLHKRHNFNMDMGFFY